MKARPISPYRREIRQLEDRIDELRRLDADWREKRAEGIRQALQTHSLAQVARRYGLSRGYTFQVSRETPETSRETAKVQSRPCEGFTGNMNAFSCSLL
jgi:AraC-like DNA-binding protein